MQEAILTASRNHLDDVMGRASFMPGADERDRRLSGIAQGFLKAERVADGVSDLPILQTIFACRFVDLTNVQDRILSPYIIFTSRHFRLLSSAFQSYKVVLLHQITPLIYFASEYIRCSLLVESWLSHYGEAHRLAAAGTAGRRGCPRLPAGTPISSLMLAERLLILWPIMSSHQHAESSAVCPSTGRSLFPML
ncbi:hypothetical protein H3U93_07975 [Bifidobacterium sp. W8115]|uniref:hypothetical protein n=1 Tax=Bifidobacterium TaxID=1678 RepID=UPI0018DC3E0E|nr:MULTISPECIES: hypothetical protein [Bifidobacterium]MBI0072255.1 hypothetical protein [Bifidobacterium sp. W8112]MBI0125491.1 hypothetical protein [Bifidobacterium apousia]